MEKENTKCEDSIDELFAENRMLKQKLEISERSKSEKNLEEGHHKNCITFKYFEEHKKVEIKKYVEKSDLVDILENTLDNKKLEIERLREEL